MTYVRFFVFLTFFGEFFDKRKTCEVKNTVEIKKIGKASWVHGANRRRWIFRGQKKTQGGKIHRKSRNKEYYSWSFIFCEGLRPFFFARTWMYCGRANVLCAITFTSPLTLPECNSRNFFFPIWHFDNFHLQIKPCISYRGVYLLYRLIAKVCHHITHKNN